MKKIFASAMIFTVGLVMAQTDAYKGEGDVKVNLGANLQDGGTGIISSVDYGLGESFSIGAQAGYLLGVKEIGGEIPKFGDRFDLKVRLNANLGSVLKLPSNVDVYPGLNLGLKNFGGHLGARYFFDKGFGLYTSTFEGSFKTLPKLAFNLTFKSNLSPNFGISPPISFTPRRYPACAPIEKLSPKP
jgi:hypothetical protein